MDLVVDANVLFAALIKDSFSYQLLFSEKFHLFTPEYVFIEIEKHRRELLDKTERSADNFYELLDALKRRIILMPLEELTEYVEEAEKITPDWHIHSLQREAGVYGRLLRDETERCE